MEEIRRIYPQYFNQHLSNQQYVENKVVFKSCNDCIVVMSFLPDTKTNESRTLDKKPGHEMTAKYRADKLKVELIFDKLSPTTLLGAIASTAYHKKSMYIVGETVIADEFDENLDNVCSNGIHYYRSLDCAFYFQFDRIVKGYDGPFFCWHGNGAVKWQATYVNGTENGKCVEWDKFGNILKEMDCADGAIHGQVVTWNPDGFKVSIEHYVDGKYRESIWYNQSGFGSIECVYDAVSSFKIFHHVECTSWKHTSKVPSDIIPTETCQCQKIKI